MLRSSRFAGISFVVLALGIAFLAGHHLQPAPALAQGPAVGGRYSVVETQATNLVVVDNNNNTLYFYAVDKGQEPGADLKLRGSINLNGIGGPVLKPKVNKQDM